MSVSEILDTILLQIAGFVSEVRYQNKKVEEYADKLIVELAEGHLQEFVLAQYQEYVEERERQEHIKRQERIAAKRGKPIHAKSHLPRQNIPNIELPSSRPTSVEQNELEFLKLQLSRLTEKFAALQDEKEIKVAFEEEKVPSPSVVPVPVKMSVGSVPIPGAPLPISTLGSVPIPTSPTPTPMPPRAQSSMSGKQNASVEKPVNFLSQIRNHKKSSLKKRKSRKSSRKNNPSKLESKSTKASPSGIVDTKSLSSMISKLKKKKTKKKHKKKQMYPGGGLLADISNGRKNLKKAKHQKRSGNDENANDNIKLSPRSLSKQRSMKHQKQSSGFLASALLQKFKLVNKKQRTLAPSRRIRPVSILNVDMEEPVSDSDWSSSEE